jgi:hypothetical protein
MKIVLLLTFLLLSQTPNIFGQEKVSKDLDGDSKLDTVYFDDKKSRIICLLSTQNFGMTQSKKIDVLGDNLDVRATKDGFSFSVDWMRSGYATRFRYDKKTKRIRLIGMTRYEFGPATNDGSGESSINLLTNAYVGNWNYFSEKTFELIKMPTIKTKMILPRTYLDTFDEKIFFDYADKCAEIFGKKKYLLVKNER